MHIYYALYDPSVSTDGNYWSWSAPEVQSLRNRFYGDVAVKHLPPNPNDLQSNDIWGGLVRLSDWTVIYRYFNGGWDRQGRPGRYILMTAWVPASEAQRVDLLPILTNETFLHVDENAADIPIPPPFALKEHWTGDAVIPSSFQEGTTPFNDLTEAMRTFAAIPSDRKAKFKIAEIRIIKTAETQKFVLDVPELIEPHHGQRAVEIPLQETPLPSSNASPKPTGQQPKKNNYTALADTRPSIFMYGKVIAGSLFVLFLLAILCVLIFSLVPNKTPPLSPKQQEIKNQFERLTPNDQERLLQELQKSYDKRVPGSSSALLETQSKQPSSRHNFWNFFGSIQDRLQEDKNEESKTIPRNTVQNRE